MEKVEEDVNFSCLKGNDAVNALKIRCGEITTHIMWPEHETLAESKDHSSECGHMGSGHRGGMASLKCYLCVAAA